MKKFLYIIVCILLFVTLGCKDDETMTPTNSVSQIEEFIKHVVDSEKTLTNFTKVSRMVDGELELYYQDVEFKVERGEVLKTEVTQVTKMINTDINTPGITFDETTVEYVTEGNKKFEIVNGAEITTPYDVPRYFLDFLLVEDYLETGYSLENGTLKAKIKTDCIDEFFLGKTLSRVNDLAIEITLVDNRLTEYKAVYSTDNGFSTTIEVNYGYDQVSISR